MKKIVLFAVCCLIGHQQVHAEGKSIDVRSFYCTGNDLAMGNFSIQKGGDGVYYMATVNMWGFQVRDTATLRDVGTNDFNDSLLMKFSGDNFNAKFDILVIPGTTQGKLYDFMGEHHLNCASEIHVQDFAMIE